MAAPDLAKELLIQYVSELSQNKGHTSLKIWEKKIHEIGDYISAIDGYCKEYNKSPVLLSDLHLSDSQADCKRQFIQGVSV